MTTPEEIKAASRHLRGEIGAELVDGTNAFGHDSIVLLKFHGIYQQDDRDVRRARAAKKLPPEYSCMVRAAVPGGVLSPDQWLALDRMADLADASLRLTTRQGVQFHFVAKDDLRGLIGTLNSHLVTTLGACGDVVRNTMACPAPLPDGRQDVLRPAVEALATHFRPRTKGYWELWVDGEAAVSAGTPEEEPIYGAVYLPRKFKIGLAWPGDNCIDVYTQDVGLVPHDGGWQLLVGGGLGMSHAREDDTYPRLASEVGWVPGERLVEAVEAVVTMQRDHGNRGDRHRARLKYLVDERGVDWVRDQIAERMGSPLAAPATLPPWHDADDHLGWATAADGTSTLGVPVPSGRVRDGADGVQLRRALRELCQNGLVGCLRVTPRQDILLDAVADNHRDAVEAVLRGAGVALANQLSPVRRLAVACPALPTCGQALGEAERVLPDIVDGVDKALATAGLADTAVRVNVTGCPNGCARPYTAEIGIVGRTKTTYDVYLGGAVGGDRLAQRLRADVRLDEVPALLAPLLDRYAADGADGEGFGDFCNRVGNETLVTLLPPPTVRRRRAAAATAASAASAGADAAADEDDG